MWQNNSESATFMSSTWRHVYRPSEFYYEFAAISLDSSHQRYDLTTLWRFNSTSVWCNINSILARIRKANPTPQGDIGTRRLQADAYNAPALQSAHRRWVGNMLHPLSTSQYLYVNPWPVRTSAKKWMTKELYWELSVPEIGFFQYQCMKSTVSIDENGIQNSISLDLAALGPSKMITGSQIGNNRKTK